MGLVHREDTETPYALDSQLKTEKPRLQANRQGVFLKCHKGSFYTLSEASWYPLNSPP